jgi:hypothetical protein
MFAPEAVGAATSSLQLMRGGRMLEENRRVVQALLFGFL